MNLLQSVTIHVGSTSPELLQLRPMSSLFTTMYGSRSNDLKKSKFLPCWHVPTQNRIRFAPNLPQHHIHYTGILEIPLINSLLVARNLGLTSTPTTLTSKAHRLLMPVRDELFIFE
jgi:hypothetical protein